MSIQSLSGKIERGRPKPLKTKLSYKININFFNFSCQNTIVLNKMKTNFVDPCFFYYHFLDILKASENL